MHGCRALQPSKLLDTFTPLRLDCWAAASKNKPAIAQKAVAGLFY
ncbi:cupin domain-containing protein [Paenibacillus rubinfantis]|nr:hypothetical protein [Paenibacillus rubinfantis]